ncbi:MAG TPA: hypothetical protein VFO85_09880, partial [Vicinamibacteria bacterium]|nr:hypothetical protein [Vicinamibacteria bacterium]
MPPDFAVRLDPWSAEYDSALQLLESEDDLAARVDPTVETRDWRPRRPAAGATLPTLAFVDGVRRVEHRVLVESAQRTIFGLLGSFAVGATHVDGRARVVHERVERVACVGGGLRLAPLNAPLTGGGRAVAFTCHTTPENTPVAPLQCLQSTMRRSEAELGDALAAEGTLVFLDGPLTFLSDSERPVVGFVKRLLKTYLPPAQAATLRQLEVGERTPLFLID